METHLSQNCRAGIRFFEAFRECKNPLTRTTLTIHIHGECSLLIIDHKNPTARNGAYWTLNFDYELMVSVHDPILARLECSGPPVDRNRQATLLLAPWTWDSGLGIQKHALTVGSSWSIDIRMFAPSATFTHVLVTIVPGCNLTLPRAVRCSAFGAFLGSVLGATRIITRHLVQLYASFNFGHIQERQLERTIITLGTGAESLFAFRRDLSRRILEVLDCQLHSFHRVQCNLESLAFLAFVLEESTKIEDVLHDIFVSPVGKHDTARNHRAVLWPFFVLLLFLFFFLILLVIVILIVSLGLAICRLGAL
mmetsp:Transcript_13802/g.23534  ORF Transcript_13802/g.23534 Transcript_13802/m.23534 type:complete len:309 (-) Transcript_13802:596-1522(-)